MLKMISLRTYNHVSGLNIQRLQEGFDLFYELIFGQNCFCVLDVEEEWGQDVNGFVVKVKDVYLMD